MRTRAARRTTAVLVAVALLTAGCGGGDEQPSGDTGTDTSSSSAASSPSETPSESPSQTSSPSASPSQTVSPPTGGLRGRLLTAAELPGFNEQYAWRAGRTTTTEPMRGFVTCQRFNITSIGAERVALRTYRPAADDPSAQRDRAGELVAVFPDDATARRAYQVLTSWRAQCKPQLKRFRRVEVGGLTSVPVPGVTRARAQWYLLTYGPVPGDADAGFFDAQGMVLAGRRIALVSLVVAGQDYNYEAGQEPMVEALRRAAQKLG